MTDSGRNELVLLNSTTGEVQQFSAEVTTTALNLPEDLNFERWIEVGHGLDRMNRAALWWLGDWWDFGNQKYGERAESVKELDWEFQTCMDAGWVAGKIETSRRRELLSWSHHREVAALDIDEQEQFLTRWEQIAVNTGKPPTVKAARAEVSSYKRSKNLPDVEINPDYVEIRRGDFRDVLADIPDGSIDLILTDPPYGTDAIPNYGWLAEFAARKLKPGGSLVCYTGHSIMPEVYESIGKHLRYWWTLSLDHRHGGQQLPGKWVIAEWKPIIWYVRDRRDGKTYLADKLRGSRPDKDAHEWAQGIDEVFTIIEALTKLDELVVDPFAGSGAFGRAALALGRQFIGADLNPKSTTGTVIV